MTSKITRKSLRSPLLALVLVAGLAGTALATPAIGFHATPLARGTLALPVQFNTGAVKVQTKGSTDIVTSTVTIDPSGNSGWHSHPGVVLVTVVSGSLTFYDDACVGSVHGAGSSFAESGTAPGLVVNLSATTPAVVFATYIVPTGTPSTGLRVDAPSPGCTP